MKNVLYLLAKKIFELRAYDFGSFVRDQYMTFHSEYVDEKIISIVAKDLFDNAGKSILMAGDFLDKECHQLVFLINQIL